MGIGECVPEFSVCSGPAPWLRCTRVLTGAFESPRALGTVQRGLGSHLRLPALCLTSLGGV